MKQTPCEYILWNGLPFIRRGIAESMINNFGLSQKETAEKLGVTPAAVCQYVSKKRGTLEISDEKIFEEINLSAERIITNSNISIVTETCRICKIMRTSGFLSSTFGCDGDE